MKRYLSFIFKSIIVIMGLFGLMFQIGFFTHTVDWNVLSYYTLISNYICIFYFICSLVYTLIHFDDKELHTFCPFFKGMCVMCITVTFVIVQTLLRGQFPCTGWLGFSFIILHYIIPIMTILDWLFFDEKGLYKKLYPIYWLAIPVIYYLYTIVLVACGYRFSDTNKYPYSFQDVDALGLTKVLVIDVCIVIFFLILGYIIYFIDKYLSNKHNKVENKH